ncbi:hypothetical protein I302_108757 [Kwoniella bestiolae CBS 10118]|uniref:Uncharacterized protein n=1 Tax=Kwoniella bestiolae CBS 10118 TaxID=1296100 RepID=A0AAJ8KGC7_9TREE
MTQLRFHKSTVRRRSHERHSTSNIASKTTKSTKPNLLSNHRLPITPAYSPPEPPMRTLPSTLQVGIRSCTPVDLGTLQSIILIRVVDS